MYQIDNDTAATTLPASTSAGTPGYFTDGNPATGLAATVLPAEFMNMLMMELANLVTAAGLTLSKTDFTQVTQAVKELIATLSTVAWANITDVPDDLVYTGTAPSLLGLELYSAAPYVDFHYGEDSSDYNMRLVNNADGTLAIVNKAGTTLFTINATAATLAGALEVKGAATLDTTLEVKGATTLDTTLEVKGAVKMDTTLNVVGASTLNGAVGISSTLEVAQAAKMDSSLDVKGLATLEAGATVTGALTATGNITSEAGLIAGLATLTSNVLRLQCADSTNAANVHLWLYNYDGTERALIYADSAGAMHFRSLGASDSMSLDASGNAVLKGSVTSGGTVYAGGGASYLASNGDLYGTSWSGLLSTFLGNNYLQIGNLPATIAARVTAGGVGSYSWLYNAGSTLAAGGTIAGSSLEYGYDGGHGTITVSGTWMAMSACPNGVNGLFMRIA